MLIVQVAVLLQSHLAIVQVAVLLQSHLAEK